MTIIMEQKPPDSQPKANEKAAKVREELLARPLSITETGLRSGLLGDLALKTVYFAGELTGHEIAKTLCLPFGGVVDNILSFLTRQKLLQVTGSAGFGEQSFRYAISQQGTERAHDVLEQNQYVGPAPVPLEEYNRMIRAQGLGEIRIGREDLQAAFDGLVVSQTMLDKIGPAINSGRSIFLYGPPGNGKTTIASRMARLLGRQGIYIPYAAEVGGQIIVIYDRLNHRQMEPQLHQQEQGNPSLTAWGEKKGKEEVDARWVLIERPIVMVGGELTLASLDLIYNPISKYYGAPLQMKANGGMFLIDDFGRQRMNPRDLLNRWIVPLDARVDFLTLHTGQKVEIPFEQLVVFSTNLDPAQLVDAAFLRRIPHKIKVDDPTPEEFCEVFQIFCQRRGVSYDQAAFRHLMQEWYVKPKRAVRNSHPRDIIGHILDIARYEGSPPCLTPDLVDRACDAYFADL